MKLRPATPQDAENLDIACAMLKAALALTNKAGTVKTSHRIRLAISSAKGAQRHMSTRLNRSHHAR